MTDSNGNAAVREMYVWRSESDRKYGGNVSFCIKEPNGRAQMGNGSPIRLADQAFRAVTEGTMLYVGTTPSGSDGVVPLLEDQSKPFNAALLVQNVLSSSREMVSR